VHGPNDDENQFKIEGKSVSVIQGDLTELEADALVNAANNHLWMGGGVAGALKRKGGQIIEDEARKLGPIPIGEATITRAGTLKAKYVIHAAGMGTDLKTDSKKIEAATLNALKRANEVNCSSIAFPSIGTGVGGFSVRSAANIMLQTAIKFIKTEKETSINQVIFVLFTVDAFEAFTEELNKVKLNL
jgi:O-acetyl-ADP-ribose deacetylase (regulator of RNase III)